MTLEELKKLIADDEGETVEVKETTGQRRDACETLCAFLNKDGGTVVFGVTKKGKLTGQLMADTTKRDLFDVFQKFVPEVKEEYGCVTTVFRHPDWTGDNTPDRRTGIAVTGTGTTSARTGTARGLSGTGWVLNNLSGTGSVGELLARLPKFRKDARNNAENVLHEIFADKSVTIPQICARTGMALRTINNALATLRAAKIVLPREVAEKRGEYTEKPSIDKNKPHIGGVKQPIGGEKQPIGMEKPHIGDGKQPIGMEKPHIGDGKQPIGTEKPHIGDEKPHIGEEKPHIEGLLSGLDLTRPTEENILKLFQRFGEGEIFGRHEVRDTTGLQDRASSALIGQMLRHRLLDTVKGHGKGKYRFRSEFPGTNP